MNKIQSISLSGCFNEFIYAEMIQRLNARLPGPSRADFRGEFRNRNSQAEFSDEGLTYAEENRVGPRSLEQRVQPG
ncbi:hypothetical protein ACIOYV_11900 [Pseudomonas sp. NPDC087342]|uniref:hypothetical protein n=1 Tax=Pseudomonas sp. NPDC087342 TaxID=3364437 RepID=UPI00380E38FF